MIPLSNKMNIIPHHHFTIKPILPKRSYRKKCKCNQIIFVYNPQRIGGICPKCRIQNKAAFIITTWYKKIIKNKLQQIRCIIMLIIVHKYDIPLQSGIPQLIAQKIKL